MNEDIRIGDFITHKKGEWDGIVVSIEEIKLIDGTDIKYEVIRLNDGKAIELFQEDFKLNNFSERLPNRW
jgi:hypothetical protein